MVQQILLPLKAMWPFCLVSVLMGIETTLLGWAWSTLKPVPPLFPCTPPEEGLQILPGSLLLGFNIEQIPHGEKKNNTRARQAVLTAGLSSHWGCSMGSFRYGWGTQSKIMWGKSHCTTQPAVDTVNLQYALCQLSETQTFINKGEQETKIHFKINNVDFDLECANRIDMSHLNKHTSQLC